MTAVLVLSVSLAIAGWVYDAGRRIAGFDLRETAQEMSALRERVAELEEQATRLGALASSSDSRLQIERTAQQQLVRQIKTLEEENSRLKEDISFFETLAAADAKDAGFSINRFRVEPDGAAGQYRFRLLAAAHGGKKEREFKGSVQLLVHLQQDGKGVMMILPAADDPNRQRYNISFKHFQRFDGTFRVPDGAQAMSVEVRLIQEGVTRAAQTVML